ncbi:hypothetical protein HID58_070348, partial [Brassica napus]
GTLPSVQCHPHMCFMDYDVQPTIDYFNWLGSNPEIEKLVNAEEAEILTAGQIYAYIKKKFARVFQMRIHNLMCSEPATSWYFIACSDCKTKATRGPSFVVVPKFPLDHKYLAKISIYDKNYQAVFVLLGNASHELTGKHSSEMTASYRTLKSYLGAGHEMHTLPQALIYIIGQTHKFRVKVSEYNFSVLPPLTTPPELPLAAKSKMALPSASDVGVYIAEEGNKSTSNSDELQKAKRSKH